MVVDHGSPLEEEEAASVAVAVAHLTTTRMSIRKDRPYLLP